MNRNWEVRTLRERQLVGLRGLEAATALLRRIRRSHPTDGLHEAADLQWWWRTPRSTDKMPQIFWFDHLDRPEAAVIATDWGDGISLDPYVMPEAGPRWKVQVIERGLAHAHECDLTNVEFEVDLADTAMRELLVSRGFEPREAGVVETWLDVEARPVVAPLHHGYRLTNRLANKHVPHHMVKRSGAEVEMRLLQTSLYRPELDLLVLDDRESVAAYGLFWYDPETATGLVEPMRTEDEHQRLGLARHLLAAGISRLADAGAERIKICFKPNHAPSRHLYLSTGFEPIRETVVFAGRTNP